MDSDGLIVGIVFVKVIMFQYLCNGVLRGKMNEVSWGQLVYLGGIEGYFGFGRVEDFEDLGFVCFCIFQNLFVCQGRMGNIFFIGVIDYFSEVVDEEDYLMFQVLELVQFINKYGMVKMQIGSGWVEVGFDL